MSRPAQLPLHLTVLQAFAYLGAVLLFLGPLVGLSACIAALAAVPVAFGLAHLAARRQVSGGVSALAVAGALLLGWVSEPCLGNPLWVSRLLGYEFASHLGAALMFGLLTLGIVAGLRLLSARWSLFVVVEGALLAAIVLTTFAAHRDSHIGRPQVLADWAFGNGYNPQSLLRAVGAFSMVAAILFSLRSSHYLRTLSALVILLVCVWGAMTLADQLPDPTPESDPLASRDKPQPPQPQPPKPQPPQPPQENNQPPQTPPAAEPPKPQPPKTQPPKQQPPQPPQQQQSPPDEDGLSFDPHDWPNRPTPMAVVSLEDDFHPASGYFYFRQGVYSRFNGQKLIRPRDKSTDPDVPAEFPAQRDEYPTVPQNAEFHQLVPAIVSLIAPHERPIGMTNVQALEARPNANPKTFLRTYATQSQVPNVHPAKLAGLKAGNPAWTAAVRADYVKAPADPRYKELADKIIAEAIDDTNFKAEFKRSPILHALAVRRWIEKNATYSLKPAPSATEEPTAAFLFGDRRGYCVHVAHAIAYLLRTQDIPTRVGAGYAPDAARPGLGSSILLQANDLHAWCEIYLDGAGWVVIDAALEHSEEPRTDPPDAATQTNFGEQNHPGLEEPPHHDPQQDQQRSRHAMAWLSLLVAIAVAAPYSAKAWRTCIVRYSADRHLYRVCYRAALDRLAEVGLSRQFGETREEFAERVATWAPEFRSLTAWHMQRAFGGADVAGRAGWLQMQQTLAGRIAATFSRRRRIAGRLNPLSWLRSG
jgi:transglutaminase-like putative cysteine protease